MEEHRMPMVSTREVIRRLRELGLEADRETVREIYHREWTQLAERIQ